VAPQRIASPQISHPQISRSQVTRSSEAHSNAANLSTRREQIQARPNGNVSGPHELAHRGGPTGNTANAKLATPDRKTLNNTNRTVTGPNKTSTDAAKLAAPNKATPNAATPSVLGQGAGNRGRNAANQQAQTKVPQQAQLQARQQIYGAGSKGSKPVLHNQAFQSFAQGSSGRDPALRALAHATFQGSFAQFRSRDRFADRRGFHGTVIGWGGPVFWPYAYTDFVDYAFYPYANDTFWPYAYDDVYDGMFGAYAPDSSAYASVPRTGRRQTTRGPVSPAAAGLPAAGSAQICSGDASGLTDWPIERIAEQVGPNDAQHSLLDQLKDATAKAVNLLQSACPTDLPSTPTGRLAQMHQRIQSMLQSVQLVRPALDKFYQSLTDEQKERFIALEAQPTARGTRTARQQPNPAQACGGSAKQITSLPINQIQQLLHPNDAQQAALQELNDATAQAATMLNQNCAQDEALTPPGRLAAMEMRLSGMLQALDTVQPAMAKFYDSLTDEQKARFDRLPPRKA
jgi:LTXXQ motif family protein